MDISRQNISITFRPMTVADIEQVHEIDTLSFTLPWSERSFRFELTENQHSIAWVAEAERPEGSALVVGMIVVWVIMDEAHIATFATHPDYRGGGIGKRLLANTLLECYRKGARLAYLEVRKGNLTAQKLYDKFGFVVAGVRPRYYKDNNEDALLMNLGQIDPDKMLEFAA